MDRVLSLTVFRRVAELRSFSAAARDLQLSNAAVSKHVAALEERVKAQLLQRTTRRVVLTAAGTAYLERAARILDELDDLDQRATGATAALSGRLRINAPLSFGIVHVMPLIETFAKKWPDLSLDVQLTDQIVDLVAEGVDVGIRVTRSIADSSSLVAHRVARVGYVVCAAPSYLAKRGVPKTPADLADHDCILYDTPEWTLVHGDRASRVTVGDKLRINNSLAIRDAVVAGMGVSILPVPYVDEHLRKKRLRALLPQYTVQPATVHVVYAKQRHTSAKIRAFVDHVRDGFARTRWGQSS